MKTTLLAATAALSLGIGSAYAAEMGGEAGYVYPDYTFPGSVYAGAVTPVQKAQPTEQTGQAVHAYVAHAQSQGTWLFPPTMYDDN